MVTLHSLFCNYGNPGTWVGEDLVYTSLNLLLECLIKIGLERRILARRILFWIELGISEILLK